MDVSEKILCILIPLVIGICFALYIWKNYNKLSKRTDTSSKIMFESRQEDGVSDRNRRMTKRRGSLFSSERQGTTDTFMSHYYREKVARVKNDD